MKVNLGHIGGVKIEKRLRGGLFQLDDVGFDAKRSEFGVYDGGVYDGKKYWIADSKIYNVICESPAVVRLLRDRDEISSFILDSCRRN